MNACTHYERKNLSSVVFFKCACTWANTQGDKKFKEYKVVHNI